MAVLKTLPEREIIDGYRGVIDFSYWKGLWIARRWPRFNPASITPATKAQQPPFAYVNKQAHTVSASVRNAYLRHEMDTNATWKDGLVKSYIRGLDITASPTPSVNPQPSALKWMPTSLAAVWMDGQVLISLQTDIPVDPYMHISADPILRDLTDRCFRGIVIGKVPHVEIIRATTDITPTTPLGRWNFWQITPPGPPGANNFYFTALIGGEPTSSNTPLFTV